MTIDRSGRKYQGKVASTHKLSVRGQQHLIAKVKTDAGKSMLAVN